MIGKEEPHQSIMQKWPIGTLETVQVEQDLMAVLYVIIKVFPASNTAADSPTPSGFPDP